MNSKLPLSVALIAFNEEQNIGRTLESIADLATEIIVVDTGSTDATREIATKYGANVFLEEWKNHIFQKNSALKKCTQKWTLSLDCDEVASPELRESIINAINEPTAIGYFLNRRTHYLGRLLKRAWLPDWKLRLVQMDKQPVWQGLNPHDELVISGSTKRLKGDLIHYSYKNISHHFEKTLYYARLSAQTYHERGRKFSFINLFLNPLIAFFKLYIYNRGFVDGFPGLLAGFSTFFYTFMKYAFLWELSKKKLRGE